MALNGSFGNGRGVPIAARGSICGHLNFPKVVHILSLNQHYYFLKDGTLAVAPNQDSKTRAIGPGQHCRTSSPVVAKKAAGVEKAGLYDAQLLRDGQQMNCHHICWPKCYHDCR